MIMYCDICGAKFEDDGTVSECPECLCPFSNVDKSSQRKEFKSKMPNGSWIKDISNDESFLESMYQLYINNPIEYQLKIQQFKNELNQKEQSKTVEQNSTNTIKCPTCSSTDVKRISTTAKVTNVALFGLLGNKRKKTFHCNNCKYEW